MGSNIKNAGNLYRIHSCALIVLNSTIFAYNLPMRDKITQSRGSALLIVLFLSSAVLVIFSSFYSVMHEALKSRMSDSSVQSISTAQAVSAATYGLTGSLPDGTRLISQTASGSSYSVFVASGSTVELIRSNTGSITAQLLDGAPARILVPDGATTASGVVYTSLSLTASSAATGTISLTSLGGYSSVLI